MKISAAMRPNAAIKADWKIASFRTAIRLMTMSSPPRAGLRGSKLARAGCRAQALLAPCAHVLDCNFAAAPARNARGPDRRWVQRRHGFECAAARARAAAAGTRARIARRAR